MIFSNYMVTTWRHMMKNKLFSAINLFGLAIGLMSCMLIILFIRSEVGYDSQWKDSARIYRLHSAFYPPEREPFLTVRSAGKLMQTYSDFAPELVESGVRLMDIGPTLIREDGVAFDENVTFVDRSFFDVFDLKLIAGNRDTALKDVLSVIISRDKAMKYFGTTDVVGKTISLCCLEEKLLEIKVTGVFENLPESTHLNFEFLSPIEESMFAFAPNLLDTYNSVNVYTYFKLQEGKTSAQLMERIHYWTNNESPSSKDPNIALPEGVQLTDFNKSNLMNIEDIHLGAYDAAGNMGDFKALGDIKMIYTFSAVAIMVLLIASINFMNLSTARASARAREVAMRKVVGASRKQIALQFLGEAVLLALFALFIALVGVEFILPTYADILVKDLSLSLFEDIGLIGAFAAMTLAIGILSGLYPAAILSRFLPASVLKANKSSDASGSSKLRSALVVFQFAISIGLVICTGVVYGQTLYAKTMDAGFQFDDRLILSGIRGLGSSTAAESLRQEIERLPEVSSVVFSSEAPTQDNENNRFIEILDSAGESGENISKVINYYHIDHNFFQEYGIKPISGRDFNKSFSTDAYTRGSKEKNGTGGVILNESAVRSLGFSSPDDAIGRVGRVRFGRSDDAPITDLEIIGVIPDIYFRSIRFGIRPSMYYINSNNWRVATIKYNKDNIMGLVDKVENIWRNQAPQVPFNYQHLSEMVANQYAKEAGQATLFSAFSGLAILIACLGLYGLASFTAERRTKEIGIRKVMGARVIDIIKLLVWQFSKPVMLANLLAWPLAIYYMSDWLSGFEYRLSDIWLYGACIVAGGVALVIAWLTVAGHAARVARSNPIKALRYE